eukprot:GFUD01122841.1.p1 GENE.GFUD01122841.1~~GFUD01122841.1.p1  ORF type:complete len:179 (-),score=34.04 GFUD01122841.1:214-711(-)
MYLGEECHTNEGSYCVLCDLGLDGEKELEDHLGMGDGAVYRCGVKQDMEMVRMGITGERPFVCSECGKGFATKQTLSIHSVVHSEERIACDQCEKSYTTPGGLYLHKKKVHEGVKYDCPRCGKQFTEKGHMTKHRCKPGEVVDREGEGVLQGRGVRDREDVKNSL